MPDFEVVDQDGAKVTSEDLIGKKTVVYFYPKDNTSGCTAEACSIRDSYDAFKAKGYNIVGVSKDSAASHRKFIEKYDLPFTLLSDTTTQMLQAFGAWGEKKMYGKTVLGNLAKEHHREVPLLSPAYLSHCQQPLHHYQVFWL